jgi:hypothetical protein
MYAVDESAGNSAWCRGEVAYIYKMEVHLPVSMDDI